jgi:hypothetical protein
MKSKAIVWQKKRKRKSGQGCLTPRWIGGLTVGHIN